MRRIFIEYAEIVNSAGIVRSSLETLDSSSLAIERCVEASDIVGQRHHEATQTCF